MHSLQRPDGQRDSSLQPGPNRLSCVLGCRAGLGLSSVRRAVLRVPRGRADSKSLGRPRPGKHRVGRGWPFDIKIVATSVASSKKATVSPLLQDSLPDFADELTSLLRNKNEPDLLEQVPLLRLVDRCRCGDDFGATLYTAPKPEGAYGPNHESIALNPSFKHFILDLVDRKIVCIEILFREDLRSKVLQLFPQNLLDKRPPQSGRAQ